MRIPSLTIRRSGERERRTLPRESRGGAPAENKFGEFVTLLLDKFWWNADCPLKS